MNAIDIRNRMEELKIFSISTGRKWHINDDAIVNVLMLIYYQTTDLDGEEIEWLFENYLQKWILDFPTARKMARIRMSNENLNKNSWINLA